MENIQNLLSLPLFRGLEERQIRRFLLLTKARKTTFSQGQTIISEGDDVTSIGIVLEGTVSIQRNTLEGSRNLIMDIEKPSMFGESLACLGARHYPVTISAQTGCTILLLDSSKLYSDSLGELHGPVLMNLMRIMALNNLRFRQKVDILSERSTRDKILHYLQLQAKSSGSNDFTIPFDRQQLADYLCIERSAMSTEISKLARDGIIRTQRSHFTILI